MLLSDDPLAALNSPRTESTRVVLTALLETMSRRSPKDLAMTRRAAAWMVHVHRNQADRPDGLPYVSHTAEVAETVLRWCPDAPAEVICAAMLHDSVEDQADELEALGVGDALQVIEVGLGPLVRQRVELLTNPEFPADGDKNALYLQHVSEAIRADPWVAAIKLADFSTNAWRLSNVRDAPKRARLADKYRPVLAMFRELVRDAPADHPLARMRASLLEQMQMVWEDDY